MELKIDQSKGAELFVSFEDECLDFCCVLGDNQQYDFFISESEWQTLKAFVEAQIQEWAHLTQRAADGLTVAQKEEVRQMNTGSA